MRERREKESLVRVKRERMVVCFVGLEEGRRVGQRAGEELSAAALDGERRRQAATDRETSERRDFCF